MSKSLLGNSIMDQFIRDMIHLYPSFNDFLNLPEYKSFKQYYDDNLNPRYITLEKELYIKYIELGKQKLKTKLSQKEDIWYRAFVWDLEESLKLLESPHIYMPINHLENPVLAYVEMALGESLYHFRSVKDYDMFLDKTAQFDAWINSAINRMKVGIQKGYILPKCSCVRVIKQLWNVLETKEYMKHKVVVKLKYDFLEQLNLLMTKIVKKLLFFMENIYVKHCPDKIGFSQYPNGKKWYREFVKSETGLTGYSVSQIHKLGIKEVTRIWKEIHQIMNQVGFKGTYREFQEMVNKKKDLKYRNKKDMHQTFQKLRQEVMKTIMSEQFPDKVSQMAILKPVPKYMEEDSPAAYYMPGDVVGKRKGVFYYNTQNPTETNKYESLALSLHEDTPGHHYQITLTNLDPHIPMFIKLLDNNAYIEGWGLYCENLGDYTDPYQYLGKLNLEMLRAIRLVVDTGIHYYEWSVANAMAYFRKYSMIPDHEMENEIYRYIVDPAQALSYKVGELFFLRLKANYLKNGGNVAEFHHQVLSTGPIPLQLLEEKIGKNGKMAK